jgi:uncharacterized protein YjbI with pentapeptide repeats
MEKIKKHLIKGIFMKKLTILATILLSGSSAFTMQSRLFTGFKQAGFAIAGLSAYLYSNKPTPAYAIEADQPKLFEKQQPQGNPEHFERLKKTGQCVGCDLRGFDIGEAYEKFAETLWTYRRWYPINVKNSDLRGAKLGHWSLSGGNFENANLEGVRFTGSNYAKCNFTNANLKNAYMSWLDLSGSNFTNANLKGARLQGAMLLALNQKSAIFTNADVEGADFTYVRKEDTEKGSIVPGTSLSRCEISEIFADAKNREKASFDFKLT